MWSFGKLMTRKNVAFGADIWQRGEKSRAQTIHITVLSLDFLWGQAMPAQRWETKGEVGGWDYWNHWFLSWEWTWNKDEEGQKGLNPPLISPSPSEAGPDHLTSWYFISGIREQTVGICTASLYLLFHISSDTPRIIGKYLCPSFTRDSKSLKKFPYISQLVNQ